MLFKVEAKLFNFFQKKLLIFTRNFIWNTTNFHIWSKNNYFFDLLIFLNNCVTFDSRDDFFRIKNKQQAIQSSINDKDKSSASTDKNKSTKSLSSSKRSWASRDSLNDID